jgi:hypothetical protein
MNDKHRFIFSTNNSDPLIAKANPCPDVVEAVLLSERYTTKTSLKKFAEAKASGCLGISDNGNFTRMSKIARKFCDRGEALLKQAESDFQKKGVVGKETLLNRSALITEIVNDCKLETQKTDFNKLIAKQVSCSPDYMIAMEDYVIPVLTMTRLLSPVFNSPPKEILAFQKETLGHYLSQKTGGFGNLQTLENIRKYIVLHSYDYASAAQGAKLYKAGEVEGVAISFGGPMASKEYIREIKIKKTTENFKELLPEPYLIAFSILTGVKDGLKDKSVPIHILGLGSPILIVLLGYLLRHSKAVSIDATSTFKDADDGNIYGSKSAFLKLDMYKVAAYALIDDEPYTSSSPYFNLFESKFPSDWKAMQKALSVTPNSKVADVADKLEQNAALIEKHIPYFTPARKGGDELIQSLRIARSGSNYFVIKRVCEEIRSRMDNEKELKSWVFAELDRYVQNASPKWAKATQQIMDIIKKHKI